MQSLIRTLQDDDLGRLRIVAELWGLEMPPGSARQVAQALAPVMLEAQTLEEVIDGLPRHAREVLDYLQQRSGRAPLADCIRIFGSLREMGPGRRDREQPWRSPVSPLEVLWYRGLIARAFADTESGPQEFLFIPSDLAPMLPNPAPTESLPFGQPSAPPAIRSAASSASIDDATTLLAALRRRPVQDGRFPESYRDLLSPYLKLPEALDMLIALLKDASLLSGPDLATDPRLTREFLEASRADALKTLLLVWKHSKQWNDLESLPHLSFAGEVWPNEPRASRTAALEFLQAIPAGTWWDLERLITDVHQRQPAFQRPAGDFSSWYFRHKISGEFLHGFEHWDEVEGQFLRFILSGPLHWLGAADLGKVHEKGPVTSFRLTPAISILFDPDSSLTIKESEAHATVHSDGRIKVPRRSPRALRYQIARFCTWDPPEKDIYYYRITPSALQAAAEQELKPTHVRSILEAAIYRSLPATLESALERWSKFGREAWMEQHLILRVQNAETLDMLRKNRTTARFLQETLNPHTVVVLSRDWKALWSAAVRAGLFIDPPHDGLEPAI